MTPEMTKTARCLRCGRKLSAARSVAEGYGRGCKARIRREATEKALAGFTPDQRAKALELIADGGVIPTAHPGIYRVVNSKGDGFYLTHAKGCNCPSGLKSVKDRPCYHRAGVAVVQASMAKAA